jgi:hypothetical protein
VLEIEAVLEAVQPILKADATLAAAPLSGRVYLDLAPRDAAYPLVILAGVSHMDFLTGNGDHESADVLFQVTVRDKGGTSKARIRPLAQAVYACLQGRELAVPGGVYAPKIRRQRVVQRGPDVVNDVVYPQIVQEFFTEAEPS